ncbi:MAG: hypothetical protein K0R69_2798, partial [Clostridia bacterium]|nr:hypothetical protein [Clostridia bacterium]
MKEKCDKIQEIITLMNHPQDYEKIETILCEESNLPGPRGNLTFADQFANCFEKQLVPREMLEELKEWAAIKEEDAPVNHPKEYLVFCGVLALGAHYSYTDEATRQLIMVHIKAAMNDNRWRTREASAMALQRIAENNIAAVKDCIHGMYAQSNNLEKRTFIAALAHPPILGEPETARFSLEISDRILESILVLDKEARKKEDFRVLEKGLQYALSVFAAFLPEEGFELLKKYAEVKDVSINKIIKS